MRTLALGLLLALLAGCASGPRIDRSQTSVNQNSRVQYVVLHYTSTDLEHSLALLTHGEVSAHYLIGAQPPTIYQLVDENRRAWHAGQSEWQGPHLAQREHHRHRAGQRGLRADRHRAQLAALRRPADRRPDRAAQDIVKRHNLPLGSIIGHSDIAPSARSIPAPVPLEAPRRRRPRALAGGFRRGGGAARFAQALPTVGWFQMQLARQGYPVPRNGQLDEATRNVIAAFQMKYRPHLFDGQPDAETAALLLVLNRTPGRACRPAP